MKRSLTLDFLRGFAIWLMIIFHTIQNTWSGLNTTTDVNYVLRLPLSQLFVFALFAYLATWAGLFLLMSTAVNVIALKRRIDEGVPLEKMRNKQLFTGFLLLAIAYFTESVLSYTGFIGYSYHNKEFSRYGFVHGLLEFRTLHIIAVSIIISSLLLYYLYRDGGHLRVKRNISVMFILAVGVLLLTPMIQQLITNYIYPWWGSSDPPEQFVLPTGLVDLLLHVVLIAINGHQEPLFPFLATAFIGNIFGIVLSQDNPPKKFPLYGMISGILLFVPASALVILQIEIGEVGFHRNIPVYLAGLAGQIMSLSLLLWIVEFRGHIKVFQTISTPWRRWSMSALSIYCLQVVDIPLRTVFHLVTGYDSHIRRGLNLEQTFTLVILTLLWWELIIFVWSKYHFKYSFEWIVVKLTTKSQGIVSERNQMDKVVYNVIPIDFSRSEKFEHQEKVKVPVEQYMHD